MRRDTYIDFLRAVGLCLIIGLHCGAPEWYEFGANFAVQLMVFVSAICYRESENTWGYIKKRLCRLYVPVLIFMPFFILFAFTAYALTGKPDIGIDKIAGSYLLLNNPSIGYVWILRILLLISVLIPGLERFLRKRSRKMTVLILGVSLVIQQVGLWIGGMIEDTLWKSVYEQTIADVSGYLPIVIAGFATKRLQRGETMIITGIGMLVMTAIFTMQGVPESIFDVKYPPHLVYTIYGLVWCMLLWNIKRVLKGVSEWRGWRWLSENSMWIYLWHIIPAYAIGVLRDVPDFWVGRFAIVMMMSIGIMYLWKRMAKGVNKFCGMKKEL